MGKKIRGVTDTAESSSTVSVTQGHHGVNKVFYTFLKFFLQFKEAVSQNVCFCFFAILNSFGHKIHGLKHSFFLNQ